METDVFFPKNIPPFIIYTAVPEDVSIVGFMSDWVSEISIPRITFVKQNLRDLSSKAFQLLQGQIKGDDQTYHFVTSARLEIRESTRKEKSK